MILGGGTHTVKVRVDIVPIASGEGPARVQYFDEPAY